MDGVLLRRLRHSVLCSELLPPTLLTGFSYAVVSLCNFPNFLQSLNRADRYAHVRQSFGRGTEVAHNLTQGENREGYL
jgi:hypothetical protein